MCTMIIFRRFIGRKLDGTVNSADVVLIQENLSWLRKCLCSFIVIPDRGDDGSDSIIVIMFGYILLEDSSFVVCSLPLSFPTIISNTVHMARIIGEGLATNRERRVFEYFATPQHVEAIVIVTMMSLISAINLSTPTKSRLDVTQPSCNRLDNRARTTLRKIYADLCCQLYGTKLYSPSLLALPPWWH